MNSFAVPSALLYRRVWRWHFYAGLFVIPLVLVLAISGSLFLFKPQIDRWEERAFQHLPIKDAVAPRLQVAAAMAAFPGSTFHSYRLPAREGDAAMVHLALANHGAMRDVFVSPQGSVLGSIDPDHRFITVVRRIHGQLLLGPRGSWLVELAASWAIVMVVTGLILWWPRGRGPAGVLWPRRRTLLRDLHAVTGFWIAGLTLVLLLTGLPWADVWGSAFRTLRAEVGWVQGSQSWTVGGEPAPGAPHAAHDHAAMHVSAAPDVDLAALDAIVAKASAQTLQFPVLVIPPGAPRDFDGSTATSWTLKSDPQDRPRVISILYDGPTRQELSRERFTDLHPIDQVIGYGIAWHEGQLFGAVNQAIGLATALSLVTMCITGFLMWRRRRPAGALGAPAQPAARRMPRYLAATLLLLALFLPLLAASLLLLWLFDWLLPRISPNAAAWLGIHPTHRELP